MDTGGSYPGGKAADNSPPYNAEVKNGGAIPPLPHESSLYGASLIKHKNNFTLHLPTAQLNVTCMNLNCVK
jgi:hypothetical protein